MADATPFGNHAPDWEPTSEDVPSGAPDLAAVMDYGKTQALRPTQTDMREAFGEPIDEGASVRWSVDMQNRENRGKYKELTQAHRRAEIERSMRWNAGMRRVQVVDPKTGARDVIPEEQEEIVGRRRGLRRFRPFDGMARIERGPDGMIFRYLAGWMPTGRTCLGTPINPTDDGIARGIQRDPSGLIWVERGGWVPMGDHEALTETEMAYFEEPADG